MLTCIGHRGAKGYEPENTLRSIELAISQGADMIEVDIRSSSDDQLILMHDTSVDRTTNGSGFVDQLSFKQIRELDAGKGERVPTLDELVECVSGRVEINLEILTEHKVDLLVEKINSYSQSARDQIVFSSFNHPELARIKAAFPDMRIAPLVACVPLSLRQLLGDLQCYSFNVCEQTVTPELIEQTHKLGMKLFVYTVNELPDIERMDKLGADGIFCDYPDRVIKYRT